MSTAPNKMMNPFPGLRAFTQDEDYLFFGREEQTIELLQRLSGNRFVAVVGTSGSGKSSLVRCGLLSEVLGGKMLQAGTSWEIAVTHPGGNPLALLTDALLAADLYDRDEEHVRENLLATLSRSHFGLVEAVKQSELAEGTNFLLVVDQFEEIFRFHEAGQTQREAANEFVSILLEAVSQTEVPIYVVLTMRSDFIGECGQFEGLAEMVNRGEFLIPRLSREQYKRVIEGPIKVAGGQIAPRLLQRLLNDLGQQADQLPCLQHALMRTWNVWAEKGDTDALDLDDYQSVGKMTQALSLHADEIYDSLASDRQRELCRGMFQALTVQESESRGIRRPQRLGRLCQILDVEAEELTPIIDAYRQHGVTFLMPSPEVELTEQTIIDISHESLMRVWNRLRQWVDEETQAAGIYRRLSESALLHEQGKAGLYRDPELGIAMAWQESKRPNAAWAERYKPGFDSAMRFLESSQQASIAEEQARESARQRELEQAQQLAQAEHLRAQEQQRSAKRLKKLVGFLAVASVLAMAACGVAFAAFRQAKVQTEVAQRAKQEADSERLRAVDSEQAATEARSQAELRAYTASLAASVADLKRNDSVTLRRRLNEAAEHLRGWEWTYLWNESDRSLSQPIQLPPRSSGYHIALSQDGTLAASRPQGGNEEPLSVHDTRSGEKVATIPTYPSSTPELTFSADNRLIAHQHWGIPGVQIYDVATGKPLIPAELQHTYFAFLGFDPTAERAAICDQDGAVSVFSTKDWSEVVQLPPGSLASVLDIGLLPEGAISPDGKLLVIADNSLRIFDLEANDLVKEIPDLPPIERVKFDDAGNMLTVLAIDGTLIDFSVEDWTKSAERRESRERRVDVAVYQFEDRSLKATFDSDGAVGIFDNRLNKLATLRGHGVPGVSIAIDDSSQQIVTAHADGVVRRWDLYHPLALIASSERVAISPDGSAAFAGLSSNSMEPRQVCQIDVASGDIQDFLRWFPVSLRHSSSVSGLAFDPNGRYLAVATQSGWGHGRWRVYDSWSGVAIHEEDDTLGDLKCIDWSADGRWIALGAHPYGQQLGHVQIHDATTYQSMAELKSFFGAVNDLAISPDSQMLVTACEDGTLRSWKLPDGEPIQSLGAPGDSGKNCVTFAKDGSYVVAGSADGTLTVWNPATGDELFKSQIHGRAVNCLAFTPDGSRLLTAAADRSIKCIDPVSWSEVVTFHRDESVSSMKFTPDGKRLALVSGVLTFLDTESELVRRDERKLAREKLATVGPLVDRVFDESEDALQARSAILADTTLDPLSQRAALLNLQSKLEKQMIDIYDPKKIFAFINSYMANAQEEATSQANGQQLPLLEQLQAATDIAPLQRQAAMELGRILEESPPSDVNDLVWKLVLDPQRSFNDYVNAYFQMYPLIQQDPNDGAQQNTMAVAEYRVGLLADAKETAEKSEALLAGSVGSVPHNQAIIAMAEHRMGQSAAALRTMEKLNEAITNPQFADDPEAMALMEEAIQVLESPAEPAWNETESWERCRALINESESDATAIALWETQAALRIAARQSGEQASLWLNKAEESKARLRSLLQSQLEENPSNQAIAMALANLLLDDADPSIDWKVLTPGDMKSAAGATLEQLDDHSILVSGENAIGDTYTVVSKTPAMNFAAIRLEALTHGSLPGRGPGRDESRDLGSFELTGFDVVIRKSGQTQAITLSGAVADHFAGSLDVSHWNAARGGSEPHVAYYLVEQPIELDDMSQIGFRMRFSASQTLSGRNLGRFRISVTDDADAFEHEQRRLKARKINNPWSRLAVAFSLRGEQSALQELLKQHPEAAISLGDSDTPPGQ